MYGVSHLLGIIWKYVTVKYVWHAYYLWWYSTVSESPNATEVSSTFDIQRTVLRDIQGDTKKRKLLKNPTKIKEIQEKNLLTEIEPLQLAF